MLYIVSLKYSVHESKNPNVFSVGFLVVVWHAVFTINNVDTLPFLSSPFCSLSMHSKVDAAITNTFKVVNGHF